MRLSFSSCIDSILDAEVTCPDDSDIRHSTARRVPEPCHDWELSMATAAGLERFAGILLAVGLFVDRLRQVIVICVYQGELHRV